MNILSKKKILKIESRNSFFNNVINNNLFEIIIAGRSNVGKSTIMNLLTHKKFCVGKRPGITLKPNHVYLSNILITDLPGFGFMSGINDIKVNIIKSEIVKYIEKNKNKIKIALYVIDIKSFMNIINKWKNRDEIPIDLEYVSFLLEMNIIVILIINKIDKILDNNKLKIGINKIIYTFKLQNKYYFNKRLLVAKVSAKYNNISSLKKTLRLKIHELKRDDLLKYF